MHKALFQQGPREGLKAGPLQCQWQKNVKCQLGEVCHHSAVPHPCRPSPPCSPTTTLSHSKSPLFLPPYSNFSRCLPLLTPGDKSWLPPLPANGGSFLPELRVLAKSDSALCSPISQLSLLISLNSGGSRTGQLNLRDIDSTC